MKKNLLRRQGEVCADYTVSIEQNVLCLIDHGNGCPVADDAEGVIRELADEGFPVNELRVIYRDTNGTWDELVVINSQFAKVHRLNEKTLVAALDKIKTRFRRGGA